MNMLLAGALAGVLSNSALTPGHVLNGAWLSRGGGSYYLCVDGVCNAYPLLLAQAPDLSGNACRGVNAAGDEISMPCAPAINPHDVVCLTSEGVIVPCPQAVDITCFPGQGTEWEQRSQPACSEVTILRGSR